MRHQCTKVPLIIRHPDGQAAGETIPGFVQHHDIFPTAMRMMGLDEPQRVMGKDAWELAMGETNSIRDTALITWLGNCSLRTNRWNLIAPMTTRWQKPGPFELYDLDNDPQELDNVVDEYPDVARDLAAEANEKLKELREQTSGTIQGGRNGNMATIPVQRIGN
jgi:arylsulfatase A-like enzyme